MKKFTQFLTVKTLTMLGVLTAGIVGSALLMATAPANAPKPKAEKVWQISAMPAEPVTLSPNLLVFGRVETPKTAMLSAAVAAEVKAVKAREGQYVEKGTLLVALDDRNVQLMVARREADVKEASARIATAKTRHATERKVLTQKEKLHALMQEKLARHDQLQQKRQVSEARLDDVRGEAEQQAIELTMQKNTVHDFPNQLASLEAQLAHSQASLEEARIDLERTQVTAPFNGRIVKLQVAPGERVLVGYPMVELYDVDALEIRATVPSQHVAALRAGLNSDTPIKANAQLGDETLTMELAQLAGRVNAGSSGVDALFRLTSDANMPAIGRALNLKIMMPPQDNLIVVPVPSLYGDKRIYTVADERLKGVEIERVGEHVNVDGEYNVLVRSEQINAGDLILTMQLPKAIDGLKIKVTN